MASDELIETTLRECTAKDRFRLTESPMERTLWAVSGTDLFGNVTIRCTEGTYTPRSESPERKVFRKKRLVEMYG